MKKKITLAFCFLLSTFYFTNAQSSWQWGKSGGSSDGASGGTDETVVDMAVDAHGNIYILSAVMQTGLAMDGHTITGWGGEDILISSFKCDGTYRWSKDIGGNGVDEPTAIKTDSSGGVYVCGNLGTHFINIHVDSDTIWSTGSSYQSVFVAKFDTAGTYKWLRMPQPDTAGLTAVSNTGVFDMDVDAGGNVCLFCLLSPGAYSGGGYIVPSQGYYLLNYNNAGTFTFGTPLEISYTGYYSDLKMKKDYQKERYYITGNLETIGGTLSFGGTPITNTLFIGCFNIAGTFLWQRQNTNIYTTGPFSRAAIDADHNIYVAGSACNMDTFNNYAVSNPYSPFPFGSAIPLVVKLDTNGNNIWAKNANSPGVTPCSTLTLNGNEVDIAGSYGDIFKWPGFSDSLDLASGAGYDVFITRFSTDTGGIIGVDSIASNFGVNEFAAGMTADKFGNFYVGGSFASTITVAGITLSSRGGGADVFAAKYGTNNCDTVLTPTLGTPAIHPLTDIVVYPNPATEELNIKGVAQNMSYQVFNITGIVTQKGVLHEGDNTISILNFAQGIYILQMTGADGEKKVVRVVKE